MKVLITGGNGFIGSHLADKLIEMGHEVTLFDLVFTKNTEKMNCEKVVGDLRNFDDVLAVVKNKDVIFHFGAVSRVVWGQQDPCKCFQVNVGGTLNVLEAVRKNRNRAIVFMGSSREVYGEAKSMPVSESNPKKPKSIYGLSKFTGEGLFLSYHKYYGVKSVIFRFSNVYGSERDLLDRVTPKFIIKALNNQPLTLYGGKQIFDYTYIDDTVNGILLALKKADEIIGEEFHFVTGKGTSVEELAKKIINLCKSNSKVVIEPEKTFDVSLFVGSLEKSSNILGYEPKVSLDEGLKRTIDLYKRLEVFKQKV
jgi:nucleoside-diphosphate-sugar epimerase